MTIAYSDGIAIEARIQHLVDDAQDLCSDSPLASTLYHEWPIRYHLSPERANLLRHLDFQGLRVLELGAGMGGISRYLAEVSDRLMVVEGAEARYKVLESRLRDLSNWHGVVANIQEADLGEQFDVVCVIGVLEYAELYITTPSARNLGPAKWFLKRATSFLKDSGVLVLAIENRLGLKYWSGAAEDHTGRLFDGICGYPQRTCSPRTFSRRELLRLVQEAGLPHVEEHFPFPDYKVPSSVLSTRLVEAAPAMAADLACSQGFESYGQPRTRNFPDLLALRGLAEAGLLPEFANSFLFIAARSARSPIYEHLLRRQLELAEVAWHYSQFRHLPTQTMFRLPTPSTVRTEKRALRATDPEWHVFRGQRLELRWHALPPSDACAGEKVRFYLCNAAYFGDWDSVQSTITRFLAWSFDRWHVPDTGDICGEAFDAILKNAAFPATPDAVDAFDLFDLEWELTRPFRRTWFLFRNLYTLAIDSELSFANAPFASTREWYEHLCRDLGLSPHWELDCAMEDEAQALISVSLSPNSRPNLSDSLRTSLRVRQFPRNARQEWELRQRRAPASLLRRIRYRLAKLRPGIRRAP